MYRMSCVLLSLLLAPASSWGEDAAQPAQPGGEEAATPEQRPPLAPRSVADTHVLEQRLDKREQQMLPAGADTFLALWLPANVGEPHGAVILLPGDEENANGAQAIGPLRRKLPDAGWHSLSVTLPDPDGDPLPLRDAEATPGEGEPGKQEEAGEAQTPPEPPADSEAQARVALETEQRRAEHARIVSARIDAAIAFAREQKAPVIVLLGHGTGAYWASRYLSEAKPEDVRDLLIVAPELPAGFTPPLDELLVQPEVAVGDFYYQEQVTERDAALRRLQASKRASLPTYVQVTMQAVPGNRQIEQEQLYRRLRGWLEKHSHAAKEDQR